MRLLENLEAYNRREAIDRLIITPIFASVIIVLSLLLEFINNQDTRAFTYVVSGFFLIPLWSLLKELIYRIRRNRINKLVANKEFDKLFNKLGKPPAAHYITQAFLETDDVNIINQLLSITINDDNENRRAHAVIALSLHGEKAKHTINDLHEVFNTEKNDYLKHYIAWGLLLIEGIGSSAFDYINKIYEKGDLTGYIKDESLAFMIEIILSERRKRLLNYEFIEVQTNQDQDAMMTEILSYSRTTTSIIHKLKGSWRQKIVEHIISAVIGYGVGRFIEFLIQFLSS